MKPPLLLDLPDRIQTPRLHLRAPRWGDGRALNAAVCDSIDELRPWLPWAQIAPSLEQSEEVVRRAHLKYWAREEFLWLMWPRQSGDEPSNDIVAGAISLQEANWSVPSFEIGYWCRSSCAGRGLISEALRAVCRFAFERLQAQRLSIRCDARNERSRRVAQGGGFQCEAHLRRDARAPDGQLRDTLSFSLLREDWTARDG